MTYTSGSWGIDAQKRSQRRTEYFRTYRRTHKHTVKGVPVRGGNSLGYGGETIGLKVLTGAKKIFRPCDLSWNGKLVDVKTAKPTITNRGTYRWKFLLSRQKNVADLFLLIRKDTYDKVKDIYLIPNNKIKGNNISFNNNTVKKYSQYLLTL